MTKPISCEQWHMLKPFRDLKTGTIDLAALRREADRLASMPAEEVRNSAARHDRRAEGRQLRAALTALEKMEI
ncbi:hypothetical protein [Shinella sp.]|uniref:hypothetical protein n=1 Tax=Shinella sp. TaxID=1870904 RepID=UPI003F7015DE